MAALQAYREETEEIYLDFSDHAEERMLLRAPKIGWSPEALRARVLYEVGRINTETRLPHRASVPGFVRYRCGFYVKVARRLRRVAIIFEETYGLRVVVTVYMRRPLDWRSRRQLARSARMGK